MGFGFRVEKVISANILQPNDEQGELPLAEYTFKTMRIKGAEGMVRGLFRNRNLQGARSEELFPGVPAVAILPKAFESEEEATDYLKGIVEQGGNAASVRVSPEEWLVAAWVAGR